MNDHRVTEHNKGSDARGTYIVYWMQQSQRIQFNHALVYAWLEALRKDLPLLILFMLSGEIPDANIRHYRFMCEGLAETANELAIMGIRLLFVHADGTDRHHIILQNAATVVMDRAYLRFQREWRDEVVTLLQARGIACFEVESDLIVPVEVTSQKCEYSAATIRPRILRNLTEYLEPVAIPDRVPQAMPDRICRLDLTTHNGHLITNARPLTPDGLMDFLLRHYSIAGSPSPVTLFTGGYGQVRDRLDGFIAGKLGQYADQHSDPGKNICSDMSPYLHFGQISVLQIALVVLDHYGLALEDCGELIARRKELPQPLINAGMFLEELIIRRELSANFCHYDPDYDCILTIPRWAAVTLAQHEKDRREREYSLDSLEHADTDDNYWNAAQTEMLKTGKMHPYMRMYWCKRLLTWVRCYVTAYETALYLNNKYALDGGDMNSYAGIAWCFGRHDRAWQEMKYFGKVRSMTAAGLERKFDMLAYLRRVN